MEDSVFIGQIFKQHCGDSLLVVEKTKERTIRKDGGLGESLYKGIFQKYPYEILFRKGAALKGTIVNPQIEQIEFIDKIWPQKCGDSLRIIKKTEIQAKRGKGCIGGEYLWEVEFIKYPYKMLVKKGEILRGCLINPEIERIEFIEKIWPQNCGDSLRIIERSDKKKNNQPAYLWRCQFIKYPYEVLVSKGEILKGQIFNPLIEEEFTNKIWPQKCGDSIKVIKKNNIKEDNYKFYKYEYEFIKYPYKGTACKAAIISGSVDNLNLPWKNKKNLFEFIKQNFNNKPTLRELSKKLGLQYSSIAAIIDKLQLNNEIEYYKEGSNQEQEVRDFLKILLGKEYSNNWNELGKEIDIYIPEKNLGIEYNGTYWHSELFKTQNYHQEKSLLAKEKGIHLIHIWEWEWLNKKDILKGNICAKLGIFDKIIYARKCKIQIIENKIYENFCENNHLQGTKGAKVKLGLFYKDELIQVMSFSLPRFTDKFEWEIIRECSKLNYLIIGGKEKLWKYFLKNYNPNSVISYCDFSKFTGESYLRLGFKFERLNPPGFIWFDYQSRNIYWRNPYKHQEMKEKYLKIYDAGQLVFTWNKKKE